MSPPAVLVEKIFNYRNEKRTVNIAEFTDESILSLPDHKESDLENYTMILNQRNPVYRSVTYVHIDPKEIAKDIMISKETLEEEYDARLDELFYLRLVTSNN